MDINVPPSRSASLEKIDFSSASPPRSAAPELSCAEISDAQTTFHSRVSASEERVDNLPSQSTRGTTLYPSIVTGLVGLCDAVSVISTGLTTYFLVFGERGEQFSNYLIGTLAATLFIIAAFYFSNLYKVEFISRLNTQIKSILKVCAFTFLMLVTLSFALDVSNEFSRAWAFWFFLFATLLICTSRICFSSILQKGAETGRLTRNVVIVGAGEQARRLIARLNNSTEPWNVIIGIFEDRTNRLDHKAWNYPILGTIDELFAFVRKRRIDDVILTLPWNAEQRICEIVTRLAELPVHVRLAPDLVGFSYPAANYGTLSGVTMLDVASKPLAGWKFIVKALEDKILGIGLFIIFSPLMGLIALAIKLDSEGPVFFKQSRYGFNNKRFSVFKFRTMHNDGVVDEGAVQAKRNDPRVTRIGRILRRTSLDELPQLFNVLKGSMSLVGPRPHPVPLNEQYAAIIRGYYARHRVKPGITGWAQVNGLRGETDTLEKMQARIEFDFEYIENWSLLRDLYILAKTAYIVWIQDNAY